MWLDEQEAEREASEGEDKSWWKIIEGGVEEFKVSSTTIARK